MLGSGNARAQQCCRAASNRNDGFDHVISDEIVVNNRTDDDASVFERKRDIFFHNEPELCDVILPPPPLLLLLLTIIGRCYRHGRHVSSLIHYQHGSDASPLAKRVLQPITLALTLTLSQYDACQQDVVQQFNRVRTCCTTCWRLVRWRCCQHVANMFAKWSFGTKCAI